MKKLIRIIHVSILLGIFTSCSFDFKSLGYTDKIQQKRVYQNFENLNRPIVFTMPVYETYALWGNKNMTTKEEREGDIFVIYDWENNAVYDWVFFQGKHGWNNWRSTELQCDDTGTVCYYSAGVGSGKLACLDPRKTELYIYRYSFPGTFECHTNSAQVTPSCALITAEGYDKDLDKSLYLFKLFNAKKGSFSKVLSFPTDSIGFVDPAEVDSYGNFWLCYKIDSVSKLAEIDTESGRIINHAEYATYFPAESDCPDKSYYSVLLADEVCCFIRRATYDYKAVFENHEKQALLLYNRNTKVTAEIEIPKSDIYYINTAVKVGEKYIGICPHELLDDYTDLLEIDLKTQSAKIICSMPIDMTESVYVRGSRIYLMNSSSLTNVKLMYYDFSTDEMSDEFCINYEDIIN